MRNVTILLAVAAMLALAAPASGAPEWVGDGTPNYEGFWNVDDNWSPSGEPAAGSSPQIKQGLCKINSETAKIYDVFVGGPDAAADSHVYVEVQTGAYWTMSNLYFGYSSYGVYGGTIEHKGGSVCISTGMSLGTYSGDGHSSTYKITGGQIGDHVLGDPPDEVTYTSGSVDLGYPSDTGPSGTFHVVGAWTWDHDGDGGAVTPEVAGTITFAGISLWRSGTLKMDLVGGDVTQIDVTGNVSLDGGGSGCSLDLSGTPVGTDPITLMTYGGSLTGTFTNVTGLPSGWSVDYGSGSGDAITLVPEPATLSLLALGGIGVLLRRRRK